MARIGGLTSGSTVIAGGRYRRDALVFVDGAATKWRRSFLMFGSHEIKERELRELGPGQPEAIIVGTETNGAAHGAAEGQSWARANDVSLLVEPSDDAIVRLNELVEQKNKVGALIHVTC